MSTLPKRFKYRVVIEGEMPFEDPLYAFSLIEDGEYESWEDVARAEFSTVYPSLEEENIEIDVTW